MASLFLSPVWFNGYDVLLEFIFAIITIILAIYAFKIYDYTNQRQPRLFAYGFLLISISYIIKSITNFLIISQVNSSVCNILKVNNIAYLGNVGTILYMVFFIAGLVTLVYMSLKLRSEKTYSLLLITTIIALMYSIAKAYTFHLLASILLVIIIIHYFNNYKRRKQINNLLVLFAFCFLLIGSIHFIISVNHAIFYFIGHILELVAYILILINLILMMKK